MTQHSGRVRKAGDVCAIFVHAGAGYHSVQNEAIHLQACNDAAKAAIVMLRNGGTAVDATEIAIKVLEDREITNAGYGSNLTMDGVVECDAVVVDHLGRSGGVGAVSQIKNPISLARVVLDHTTKPLLLKRVPPNLLVSQGAVDFAFEQGLSILPHDALVSPAARERWVKWRADLRHAERRARQAAGSPISRVTTPALPDVDPYHEEQVRKRIRQEHTQRMIASSGIVYNSLSQSIWAHSSPTSKSNTSTSLGETNSSRTSLSITDEANVTEPASLAEAAQNPLINSTQTLPTLLSFNKEQGPVKDESPDADVEMSDIDDDGDLIVGNPSESRPHKMAAWHDGSSDSESSSGTLRLPSLTPSPPPKDALEKPLPTTPEGESKTSTLSRSVTNLEHVIEHAPLPPDPSSKKRKASPGKEERQDNITDTVGAIAIDCYGNMACGASSGGIGMKYRGRIGPAALVGVGAAVVPNNTEDKQDTSVAAVTSGTGEHMATTMAATVFAERLYYNVKKTKEGTLEHANTEDDAIRATIEQDFMGHASVTNSASAGAIGVLTVKKMRDGLYLYFAHNTDSFAIASMHSDEDRPSCTMSRSTGNGAIAQGGRALRYRRKQR